MKQFEAVKNKILFLSCFNLHPKISARIKMSRKYPPFETLNFSNFQFKVKKFSLVQFFRIFLLPQLSRYSRTRGSCP